MTVDVISYLDSKHIEYSRQGNEALIFCPYCNKQKLSINILTGAFQCWVCQAENPASPYQKGHISELQKEWGDMLEISTFSEEISIKEESEELDFTEKAEKYHKAINKKAMKYLMGRGFDEEDIEKFKFGFAKRKGDEWISIPVYEKGVCKLIKYRRITKNNPKNKKYDREKGGKSIFWNQDALEGASEIYVAEGELDAITLAKQGYPAVGATVGAGTLSEEYYNQLIKVDKVYLVFDADSAGQNAAKDKWATRLGIYRCWNVLLPKGYDINKFFLHYTKEDFDELVSKAKQFKISGVVSLKEALHEAYRISQDKENNQIFELPWYSVNRLLGGGLARKRLTVLGGMPKAGKTSWAIQVCYYLTLKYGIPTFYFCLEMPETTLAIKIIQLHEDLTTDEIDMSNALIFAQDLKELPIYFGYSSSINPEVFYNTMVEVRNRYGVELGVFDNLQAMVRSERESDMGKASKMFKELTMDLNIPFILISQPRERSSDLAPTWIPTYEELKGSSAIPADADEVILLHRKRIQGESGFSSLEPETLVIVDASRFAPGGRVKLNFVGEKSRFDEINA